MPTGSEARLALKLNRCTGNNNALFSERNGVARPCDAATLHSTHVMITISAEANYR